MPAENAVQARTDPSVRRISSARIRLRTISHPMTGVTIGKKCVVGIEHEQQAGQRRDPAGRHREDARFAPKRSGDDLDQSGGDQKPADHVGGDALARRKQGGADAEQDDRDPGDAQSARAVPVRIVGDCAWVAKSTSIVLPAIRTTRGRDLFQRFSAR